MYATNSDITPIPSTFAPAIPVESGCRALAVIVTPRLEDLARETAADHEIPYLTLVGPSLCANVTLARHDFMWRARRVVRADGKRRYSTTQIGRFFQGKGGRTKPMDHTSVLHGERKMDRLRRAALLDRIRWENDTSAIQHGGR